MVAKLGNGKFSCKISGLGLEILRKKFLISGKKYLNPTRNHNPRPKNIIKNISRTWFRSSLEKFRFLGCPAGL